MFDQRCSSPGCSSHMQGSALAPLWLVLQKSFTTFGVILPFIVPMADMSSKPKIRPKKGPVKRNGNQRSKQEKRDVDIMNVSASNNTIDAH